MLDKPYGPQEYVTTKELARRIGVTANCIERWRLVGKGPLPTYLNRHCVRYLWANCLRWLETGSR